MTISRILTAGVAVAGLASLLAATAAEAAACRSRISGKGAGQGILGAGTMNAKAAARTDFEARAAARFGKSFANLEKAKSQVWDCRSGTLKAVCVVTANPCR